MDRPKESTQAITYWSTAVSGKVPKPRQDPDLTENDGLAGGLTQRLVDRKLDELRRASRDPKRATDR